MQITRYRDCNVRVTTTGWYCHKGGQMDHCLDLEKGDTNTDSIFMTKIKWQFISEKMVWVSGVYIWGKK